nr:MULTISPECIES: VCBS domain-containing protein [Bradyrhizobium]
MAGKFSDMTPDGQGAHPGAHVHVGTVSGHAPADAIIIPDAHLLFTGDFKRAGVDLVVSGDGHEVVLHDYFKGEKRAALASPDGAHLTGDLINALTGHTQFAQADGSASVAQVIGHVTKLTGTATAIRNGVSIILNQGDNVNKGDVVQSGSDSTLGITFIDGTVFGLASNAKMVLNEMIYDPNGSDNKSLISLVQGTISFVAGATAKHGDMKVDTPVATMGIRGTAVLVEIDFTVPATGDAPPAKFQVLVEPDGTTGSYILFDKTTLTPIATVNQAGTQTIVSGQGTVNFLSSAPLSADAQKIITDVFALKFSDLNNPNTKTATNFTDSITQQNITLKTASGEDVAVKVLTVNVADKPVDPSKSTNPSSRDHIPGPPEVVTHGGATTERALTTGSTAIDSVSGTVAYADINPGDVPTVKTTFASFTYQNAGHTDVTATLTAAQLAAIHAVETPLVVVQDPTNINHGVATWTYNIADHAFDFLAAGEVLTLTYTARVDNNFALNNEFKEVTFTITITGTNDTPVITTGPQHISFTGGTTTPGPFLTTSDATSGTLSFTDVDLTDTHTVSTKLTSALLSGAEISTLAPAPLNFFKTALTASIAAGHDSTQKNTGTIDWNLADLRAYLADFVPAGDTLTLVYTVTVTDSQGATSTQDITVTITGNNTPAVVWVATTASGSTGDWNDAANWETGTRPTGTDDAIIITNQLQKLTPNYPVTINAAAFAKTVTMNDFGTTPPELDNNSTLQIGGAFDLFADSIVKNAGAISVGGAIEVQGTSQLTNSGTLNLAQGGDFKDSSSITNLADGIIDLKGGTLTDYVVIINSGLIKVESGTKLVLNGGGIDGGIVTNFGTIEIAGTGSITNDALANHQLTVDSGKTLTLDGTTITGGTITDGGTVHVTSGKTLTLNGVALDGGIITNAGTIEISGTGSITNDTFGNNQLTVDSGKTLTLDGTTITGGAITDGGTVHVTSGQTLTLNGVALDGGIITNAGTIEIAGTGSITNDAFGNNQLTVDSGKTLTLDGTTITGGTITDGGTVHVTSGQTLTLNGVALDGGKITNAGTIEIAGTGSITNDTFGNNQLTVDSGKTLTLDGTTITGGAITDGGTVNVGSGKTLTLNGVALDGGIITNAGTIEIAGTGSITNDALANNQLTVDSGQTLTIDGSTITGGAVTNSGATLKVTSGKSATLNDVTVTGGNITDAGTINVALGKTLKLNGVALDGGAVGNSGTIEIAGTGSITNDALANNQLTVDSGQTLTIDGSTITGGAVTNTTATLKVTSGQTATLNDVTVTGGNITDGGTVNIASGKTLKLNGVAVDGGAVGNSGTIEITGTGSITNDALANNQLTVDSGRTLTIDGSTITGGAVTNSGATLKVNGSQTATLNDVTVTGGTITDGGTVNVAGGKTLKLNGVALDGGAVGNSGTIEITGTGSITNDALANNQLTVDSGQTLTIDGTTITGGAVTNTTATLKVNGGQTATLNDVTVTGGSITDGGTVNIASGKTLTLNGVALDGGIITNAGTIEIAGTGSITNDTFGNNQLTVDSGQTLTIDGSTITGGAVTNSGATLKVNGSKTATLNDLTVTGGAITDGGTVNVASGKTLTLNGVALDGGIVTNAGAIEISGTGSITNDALANNQLTVDGGQTLTIDGSTIIGGAVTNTGATLKVTSGKIATLNDVTVTGGAITDGGTVNVASGKTLNLSGVALTGGAFGNSGTVNVSGSSSIGNDYFTNNGALNAINNGTLELTSTTIANGFGTIAVAFGSTLDLDNGAVINGGALGNSGTIQIETSSGATLNGVTVTGGGAINVDYAALAATLILEGGTSITGGTLVNGTVGTIEIESAAGAIFDDVGVTNVGTLQVDAASQLVLQNGATIAGGGVAVASGGLLETHGAGIEINAAITNDGTIEIKDGTLKISTSISGTGSVRIDGGAAFELNGSDSQTVEFHGDNAVLKIDGASFGGSIAGFAATDEINLKSIAYDATTTATFVNGVLTIFHGSDSIAMTMVGDYSHAHLAGAGDATHTLITFNAADDAPVFAEKSETGSIEEQLTATGSSALDSVGGTLHFADVDLLDRPTATITSQSVTWTAADHHTDLGTPPQLTAIENALTLAQSGNTNNGTIGWNYSIADGVLDFLAEGETITLTSKVTVNDGEGKTDTATVIVTITGHNDAPVLAADTAASHVITEQPGLTGAPSTTVDKTSGSLTFTDVDLTDTHTVSHDSPTYVWSGGALTTDQANALTAASTLALTETDSTGSGAGSVAFDYSAADNSFDFLAAGQTLTITYNVTVVDYSKGVANGTSSVQPVTITIHGTNDAATITATTEGSDTGAVTEDGTLTASGSLTVTDVDSGENHFQALSAQALTGTYGSFTFDAGSGTWSYALNNAASNVQALTGTDVVHDTLTVTSADGTDSHVIDVTIHGTNDPATITAITEGSDAGAVTEDGTLTASGSLTVADVDHGENHFQTPSAQALTGTYGSFSFDAGSGTWSYALNNAASNVQALGGTDVVHDTLTVTSADGTDSHVIDVTVHGTNDPATITATTEGSDAGAVTEDGTLMASGALTVADVDHGENHFQTPSAQALTGTYGSFSFDAGTGKWSYALNNAASNVQALSGTDVVHDTLTVKSADGTDSHVIDVTIHGTNDAPVADDFSITNAAPSGDGWILDPDNGHYYRLVTTNLSWSSANATAQGDGAYLATITSQAEQNFVAALATGNRAWLGGGATDDDTGAGHFTWLTGPEAGTAFDYTHWRAGEPNGGFGATEYVHIEGVDDSPNGGWNDAPDAAGGRDFIEEWGGQTGQVAFREDTGTTLTSAQLLAHATDVDSTLTVTSVSAASAHGGTVSLDGGIVTYHPAADYNGADSFTYTVSDGSLTSTATVSFNVAAVNDAPVFTGNAVGTAYAATGAAVAIATNVVASDIDSTNYNGGTLTATVIAGGNQGDTLSIASNYISMDGNEILFDADGATGPGVAVDIGALTNNGINSLTITLNSGADDAAVAALAQAVEFSNAKPDPVTGTRTVAFTLHDGGGTDNGGHDSAYFTADVNVTAAVAPAPAIQLLDATFLGGAGDQAATAVTYANGHLYLTYNAPITQSSSDHSTVVGFTTGAGAPTQDFSEQWSYGFFTGVAADANTIYAAGGSHPSAGLTHDGVGGAEEKSILVGFNADGTAGSSPAAPATEYAANNFFSYTGTEMFQNVLATTQGGNTILYATGFGQPASYGAYILAEYSSAGTLLHAATDPLATPGFSNAYDAVEFNGAIWAVGNTQHSGDATNTATVWTASHDLSSVVTHKDVTGAAAGNFASAAVVGNALFAVGNVNSNGGDFLIAKYNTDGSVAWSESFGGSGADTLNGAVALDGHLYVVGSTTSGGSTDGVLMEINTADGSVVSSTTYGGALYDSFNSITTDGHNLYVAGESKSFTHGGNGAGQDDAILLTYSSGHGTPAPGSSGPVIETDQFTVTENGGGVTTVSGLRVADADATAATDTFTMTAATDAAPGSSVTPGTDSGSLADLNTTLSNGVVYSPGVVPPQTDAVTFTVADSFGGHDTVHFIFNQGGTGPDITLTGTSGKDVIFATGNNDTLTGGAGADQFVFRPSGNANSDTITDFSPGLDHIDLRAFSGTVASSNLSSWLASHASVSPTNSADVLITLDANDAVTLKNVALNNLHVGDFIVSPHIS